MRHGQPVLAAAFTASSSPSLPSLKTQARQHSALAPLQSSVLENYLWSVLNALFTLTTVMCTEARMVAGLKPYPRRPTVSSVAERLEPCCCNRDLATTDVL